MNTKTLVIPALSMLPKALNVPLERVKFRRVRTTPITLKDGRTVSYDPSIFTATITKGGKELVNYYILGEADKFKDRI